MQFMLLIYGNEQAEAQMSKEAVDAMMAEYFEYSATLRNRGAFVAGEALHPTSAATTVRVRSGKSHTSDGPFAQTVETFSGYYVVECKDEQTALELAALCPGARMGSVEVRPVVDFSASA
jgi:hypothetical protein